MIEKPTTIDMDIWKIGVVSFLLAILLDIGLFGTPSLLVASVALFLFAIGSATIGVYLPVFIVAIIFYKASPSLSFVD